MVFRILRVSIEVRDWLTEFLSQQCPGYINSVPPLFNSDQKIVTVHVP